MIRSVIDFGAFLSSSGVHHPIKWVWQLDVALRKVYFVGTTMSDLMRAIGGETPGWSRWSDHPR